MVKFCDNCVFKYGWYDKTNPFPEECTKCNLVDGKPTHYMQNPNTNADRIRAMSDEELAKMLDAFTEYFTECNRSTADVNCEDCELCEVCSLGEGKALNWLQQPAEGE